MFSGTRSVVGDFWRFYRDYSKTALHTASTAALAMFGLLVFVDPWFALLAIASYVAPPITFYVLRRARTADGVDGVVGPVRSSSSTTDAESGRSVESNDGRSVADYSRQSTNTDAGDGDTDADDGDTDADDGDTDADDGDTDADDGDTDTDT